MIMKKIFLVLFLLIGCNVISQEYNYTKNAITGVFSVENKSKNEIYSSINKWISINYNSAKNVIQLNDKDAGNIIIKGINESTYKNALKEVYPNNAYIPEYNTIKFNHTIEINIKEDRYRIIYTLTDIINDTAKEYQGFGTPTALVNALISLNGIKQDDIDAYNNFIEETWKKYWVGKKRRNKQKELTKPVFEELNKSVIEDIKLTMKSIKKSIVGSKKDDW